MFSPKVRLPSTEKDSLNGDRKAETAAAAECSRPGREPNEVEVEVGDSGDGGGEGEGEEAMTV